MIGPDDLNTLGSPESLWINSGIEVGVSRGDEGAYYEINVDTDSPHTVSDVIAGLRRLPGDAQVRDAFNYNDGICLNFWRKAA